MKNILVAEDDPQLQKLYKLVINRHFEDVKLSQAFDGSEALDFCRSVDFSAIISDIDMPNMDGISFYKALKSTQPELAARCAFVSASSADKHMSFIRGEGCAYLPKPFKLDTFTTMLEGIIGKSETTEETDTFSECKRAFPRIKMRERCVLQSTTGLLKFEPFITETVDYSDGGISIEYNGSKLPAGINLSVNIEKLGIKEKVAQIVWTGSCKNEVISGLKWL